MPYFNQIVDPTNAFAYSFSASAPMDGARATFAAAGSFSPGTAATTDIAQIFGSASATVRVLRVGVSATGANAAAYVDTVLSVRSAAPTGGTATTLTNVPYDSKDVAATAVAKVWTVAPTAGAAVGSIAAAKLYVPVATASIIAPTLIFDFGNRPGRAVVLRGVAQGLVLTFSGATFATTAPTVDFFVEWTEDPNS